MNKDVEEFCTFLVNAKQDESLRPVKDMIASTYQYLKTEAEKCGLALSNDDRGTEFDAALFKYIKASNPNYFKDK